jgi:hypothetical protein
LIRSSPERSPIHSAVASADEEDGKQPGMAFNEQLEDFTIGM